MLEADEIRRFIEDDRASEKKRRASVGQRYYEGEHDILQYKLYYYNADGILVEDKARSNIKIRHPFFTELADQLSAYMLSFDRSPIQAEAAMPELQDHLDEYFNDDFWSEIQDLITGAYAKGFEYLYAYKDQGDRMRFACADSLGVVEVRAKDTDSGCEHIIYWYVDRVDKGRKVIKRIQVFDADQISYYVQVDNGEIVPDPSEEINPRPHVVWADRKTGQKYGKGLGYIPFWRLDNNRRQSSGLEPIKGLIDDYDLMECGLSNNLQDFDMPIHVVSGFQGDNLDELQTNIRTKKMVGVDDTGGLDIKTVDVPYLARKAKADEDEKNIYRFGMGYNSAQVGDGNITNVVIRSRYTLLELKAGKLEKRLKQFLRDVIRVVLDEVNTKHGTAYSDQDVTIKFEHIIPTNESETVQNAYVQAQTEQLRVNTALQAAAVIGDEEALKALCDVMGLDFDDLKGRLDEQQGVHQFLDARDALAEQAAQTPAAE